MPKRNPPKTHGASDIDNIIYNEQAGGQKNLSVGPSLKPLRLDATTFTTDASTMRKIPMGVQLAVYNNAGAVGSVTLSKSNTRTSLAPGVVDNTAGSAFGDVGVPCPPNAWTYLSGWDKTSIITSAATLLVFIIEDDTTVK